MSKAGFIVPELDGPMRELLAGVRACLLMLATCLALVASLLLPGAAWGDELELSGEGALSLAAVDVVELPVSCKPDSIETGIPCGMDEMCGQDPCLCGAVDDWGACACNGTRTTRPSWALSLDADAGETVHLVEFAGRMWVVSFGIGGASSDGTLKASLVHFDDASMPVHVDVAPFGILDFLKIAAALFVAVGFVFALGAGIRALIGRIRRKVAQSRRKRETLEKERIA